MGKIHKIYVLGFFLVLLAGAGLAFTLLSSPPPQESMSAADPAVCDPFGVYSPGSLDEVPGDKGQAMIASLGLMSLDAYEDYSVGLVDEIGATWVRADFLYEDGHFRDHARLMDKYRSNGKDVVGCIRPADPSGLTDLATFEARLRELIQEYPWIKTWQVGNEGNLSWNTPEDYARFFLVGQRAVREECPRCDVALAGVEALLPTPAASHDSYDRIISYIMGNPTLGARPFDIFDFHYYGYYGAETAMVKSLDEFRIILDRNGLSDVAIWTTESATTTGQISWPPGLPVQTEDEQAAELVRRFVTLLGAGVERISWARPYENYRYADYLDGYFDNAGLIFNGLGQEASLGIRGGTPKKSFRAYQTMTGKLQGCFNMEMLAPRQYKASFNDSRRPVYVIWGTPESRLNDQISGKLTVTATSGETWETDAASLAPGMMPVFVELHE